MSEEIEKQILEELRSQTRFNKLTAIIAACIIGALLTATFITEIVRSRAKSAQSNPKPWAGVTAAYERYDFDKAIALAEPLVAKHPNDDYGCSYLAQIYFLKGDLANAEKNYAHAYELFPSEEHEKSLAAIRKRRAHESAGAAGPGAKP